MSRRYRVVRLKNGEWMRWAVVSVSLRGDETWDVIQEFTTRAEAFAYVGEVDTRNRVIESNECSAIVVNESPGAALTAPGMADHVRSVISVQDTRP